MITLNGITWDHARGYDPLIAASELYKKENDVQVNWHKRSLANFGDQSLVTLAKQFDLIIIDHPHVGVAEASLCLQPLNDLLAASTLDALRSASAGPSFESYYYRSIQWALPIDAAMQCASSRIDLLGNLAIPNNWKEVFELSNSLKEKNIYVGMALCPTDCLCSFLSIAAQLGSPIAEGNELLVAPAIGFKALNLMRSMRDHFHPKALQWNPIALYDYMSSEDDIAYCPLAFCYTNYSRLGIREKNLQFHNVPETKNAVLGGAGIAVTASCKEQKTAADFAAWICSAPIQASVYVNEQGQPGNKFAWQQEAANKLTNNFFSNTLATLSNAYVRPRYQGWPKFQEWLGKKIHSFLVNDTDAELLLKELQEGYRYSY
ncbi:MAG: extracellular solute-binding protein [Bacteroidota bacterium]